MWQLPTFQNFEKSPINNLLQLASNSFKFKSNNELPLHI